MNRNYSLESRLNQISDSCKLFGFGSVVLSSFLLLSPAKTVGYIGLGAGFSAVAVSIVDKNRYINSMQRHVDELQKQNETSLSAQSERVQSLESEKYSFQQKIKRLNSEVSNLSTEKDLVERQLEATKEQVVDLTRQCDYFRKEWEVSTQRLEDFIGVAKQAVSEAIEEWQKKITLLASTKTDYSKLAERLIELLKEGQEILDCYSHKLDKAKTKVNSLDDLLSIYFCLNDEMVGIKTRMIKSINVLSVQEKELDLDESYGSYEGLKEKYVALQKQYNQTVKDANA